MEGAYHNAAVPVQERKGVQVSLPVMGLALVATVAATVAVTLALTPAAPAGANVAPKFATGHAQHRSRGVAMRAGRANEAGYRTSGVERKTDTFTPPNWSPPTQRVVKNGEKAIPVSRRLDESEGWMYAEEAKSIPAGFGEELGAIPPVGYLDPFGYGDKASPQRLRWFREAELKHGRVAMLAAVGFLVGENPILRDVLIPGKAGSNGLASNTFTDHQLDLFWYPFVAGIGALEVLFFDKFESVLDLKLKDDYAVGDLGFDPLGLKTDENFAEKRTKELQNGRLAMLAIAGFNAQELTDGKPIWPLHAFQSDASAAEINDHISKGMDLVKEMGQMLSETGVHH